jgi:hypothetical protein
MPIGEADARLDGAPSSGGTQDVASAAVPTGALHPLCGAELRASLHYADGPPASLADVVTTLTTP